MLFLIHKKISKLSASWLSLSFNKRISQKSIEIVLKVLKILFLNPDALTSYCIKVVQSWPVFKRQIPLIRQVVLITVIISFLKLERERNFANISDRPTFLTVSELFWSSNGHKRWKTSFERLRHAQRTGYRGTIMQTGPNLERIVENVHVHAP